MKCIYTVLGLTLEDKKLQKKYVVVNVTIKYYLILCFINVKADLHSTVRPGPMRKHKLTFNRKTDKILHLGLLSRQKESWPAAKSIVDSKH